MGFASPVLRPLLLHRECITHCPMYLPTTLTQDVILDSRRQSCLFIGMDLFADHLVQCLLSHAVLRSHLIFWYSVLHGTKPLMPGEWVQALGHSNARPSSSVTVRTNQLLSIHLLMSLSFQALSTLRTPGFVNVDRLQCH